MRLFMILTLAISLNVSNAQFNIHRSDTLSTPKSMHGDALHHYLRAVTAVHNAWSNETRHGSLAPTSLYDAALSAARTCVQELRIPGSAMQELRTSFEAITSQMAARQGCGRPLKLLFVRIRDDIPAFSKASEALYGSIMLRQYEMGAQLAKQVLGLRPTRCRYAHAWPHDNK
jgi:hypothetical protein